MDEALKSPGSSSCLRTERGVFFFQQQRGMARVTSIYFRLPYFLGSVAGRCRKARDRSDGAKCIHMHSKYWLENHTGAKKYQNRFFLISSQLVKKDNN